MNGYVRTPVPPRGQYTIDSPETISLDAPNYAQIRHDRLERNRTTMQVFSREVAANVIPKEDNSTVEEKAAVTIQAQFRGHLGRKQYVELLYSQFEKEEKDRLEKTMKQVEEGESLVEIHNLEIQLDDNDTARRNKTRHLKSQIITIQRAWRAYKKRLRCATNSVLTVSDLDAGDIPDTRVEESVAAEKPLIPGSRIAFDLKPIPITPKSTPEEDRVRREGSVGSDIVINPDRGGGREWSPGAGADVLAGRLLKPHRIPIDSECESSVSDYSELTEAIKDHFVENEGHITKKEDLRLNDRLPTGGDRNTNLQRLPAEDDEDFARRIRKTNLLSLAQEFAALKKINSEALPFDLHKTGNKPEFSPVSDAGSDAGSVATESDQCVSSLSATPSDEKRDFPSQERDTSVEKLHDSLSRGENTNKRPRSFQTDKPPVSKQRLAWAEQSPPQSASTQNNGDLAPSHTDQRTTPSTSHRTGQISDKRVNTDKGSLHNTSGGCHLAKWDAAKAGVMEIETALPPKLDIWSQLDEQIKRAEEDKRKQQSRRNDREEILRKLAAESFDEADCYTSERFNRRPNLQTRLQSGMNLQICFVNESYSDQDSDNTTQQMKEENHNDIKQNTEAGTQDTRTQPPAKPPRTKNHTPKKEADTTDNKDTEVKLEQEDFFSKQARLQADARLALAQAKPMAQMQVEIDRLERQKHRKSTAAQMIGIAGFSGGKWQTVTLSQISAMNIAPLQVIVNELHTHIEAFNEELVQALIKRDDLHMEQDSMLVDIEDLTKRAQECAQKVNVRHSKKTVKKK